MYIITPIGNELSSDVSTVKTYSLPAGANAFWVQAITQNIRIRISDNNPTTAIGGQLKAGDPIRLLSLGGGRSFRALQEAATAYFYCQPVLIKWIEP